MALNRKKGLKELFVERNKGTLRPQPLHTLLPPPSPPTVDLLPIPIPNLKKKRKEKEIVEEGEVVSQKESKHQKMAKDKGCPSSIESKEAEYLADMCHPTWNPQLELDGTAVPQSSSIREFQKGHAHYMAEALKRPLLCPRTWML